MPQRNTVLVVDDQPENIHVLLQALRDDYAVLAATSGEQALRLARKTPAPDVILLDVMMPGMDGYEVCRQLKADEATREIPVIFVTALHESDNEARGLELGAIDYVTKPVKPVLLKARVANHIALRQAARLREDVERIVRHDLRGAVVGIIGLPRLVRQEATLSNEHREMLQLVEQAGYRMLQMLNLGLDLYKMEQGTFRFEPSPVDLAQVLRDTAAGLRETVKSRNVRLELLQTDDAEQQNGVGSAFALILGDPLLCHCMADNLLRNALEASPPGDAVRVSFQREAGFCLMEVHNQGTVPQDIRERFFEKYATCGKPHGTGLGAYSARLMARTMGGDISWISSEKDGTRITVRLPLTGKQTAPPSPQDLPPEGAQSDGRNLRILVVDDDLQAGMLLKRQLMALGHETELAAHGREALERYTPGRYHLVLMDKEMPEMDGAEACGHIRRLERETGGPAAYLAALTGHDSPQVHQELLRAGFTRTLQKPLQPEVLRSLLAEAASMSQGMQTPPALVLDVDEELRELLPGLLAKLPGELQEMANMVGNQEWEPLRRLGHKRKGTCRAYGLTPLADGFEGLENAAAECNELTALQELDALRGLLDRLEVRYQAQ